MIDILNGWDINVDDFISKCGGKFKSNHPNIFLDTFNLQPQWRYRVTIGKSIKDYFISFYPYLMVINKPCFIAYTSVEDVPDGRNPSTVDNISIGKFNTLDDAINCIVNYNL